MGQVSHKIFRKGLKMALDTVALIYFLERHPRHYLIAQEVFQRLEAGDCAGVMSSLVFAELLVPAYKAKDVKRAAELLRLLSNFPNLEIVSLTPQISAEAAALRARYGMRTPDAIHAATALMGKADCIITNDKGFLALKEMINIFLFDA